MRFVPIRSTDAQSILMRHRAAIFWCANGPLKSARCGRISLITAPWRAGAHLRNLLAALGSGAERLPDLARQTMFVMAQMIDALSAQICRIEMELLAL